MRIGNHSISSDIATILVAILILLYLQYARIALPYVRVSELIFLAIILLVIRAVYPVAARLVLGVMILLFVIRIFFSLPFLPLLVVLLLIFMVFGLIG